MAKATVYTKNDEIIVNILKDAPDGLTLGEINERLPEGATPIKSGNLTAAKAKGLIDVVGDRPSMRKVKRTVTHYALVSEKPLVGEDGKPFNYTDNETKILGVIAGMEDKNDFTLEMLANALGVEKVYSGSINALVNKKGNIKKIGSEEKEEIASRGSVNVYACVGEIPEGAEIKG